MKKILNRLVICKVNNELEIKNMYILKEGIFSKSGAIRAYILGNQIVFFIPIFKDFEIEFPNYFIHKFVFELDQEETFESFIKKFHTVKGTFIDTGLDKTTCFNLIETFDNKSINYNVVFSARNNLSEYKLYLANLNDNLSSLLNIRILKSNESLSYPFVFKEGNMTRIICSLGRYGDRGIIFSNIK